MFLGRLISLFIRFSAHSARAKVRFGSAALGSAAVESGGPAADSRGMRGRETKVVENNRTSGAEKAACVQRYIHAHF